NSAKRRSPIADTLDRFLERVRDEPEHAAHFAQEIPEAFSDLLERNRRRRDQRFFGRVLFLLSHGRRGSCPSSGNRKSDFFSLAQCRGAVYLFEAQENLCRPDFFSFADWSRSRH